MNLAVLGDRIFVRPLNIETETDTGLLLVRDNQRSVNRGVVVAVGEGPELAHRAVQRAMSALNKMLDSYIGDETIGGFVRAVAARIKGEGARIVVNYAPEHLVMPGDEIIFSPDAGEEVRFERDIVLVMRESDVLAVIDNPDKETE